MMSLPVMDSAHSPGQLPPALIVPTPSQHHLPPPGNKRAVRILLERFLLVNRSRHAPFSALEGPDVCKGQILWRLKSYAETKM